MPSENSKKNLKLWKKGQSGNPAGRKPTTTTQIIRELVGKGYEPVTPTMIVDAYQLLITLTLDEVKAAATNESYPMYVRILCREMLKDKGSDLLEKMLDRAHGKAKQSTDITTQGGPVYQMPDFSQYSKKELKELLNASRSRDKLDNKGT